MGNCGLAASATGNESASAPLNTLARLAKTSGVDEFNHLRPLASRCGSGLNSQQQAELTAALKSLKLELGVGAHSKALREVRQLLVKLYSVTNLVEDHHHITFCLQVLEARDKETETSNGGSSNSNSSGDGDVEIEKRRKLQQQKLQQQRKHQQQQQKQQRQRQSISNSQQLGSPPAPPQQSPKLSPLAIDAQGTPNGPAWGFFDISDDVDPLFLPPLVTTSSNAPPTLPFPGKVRLSSSAVSASVVMTKPRSRASSYGSYGDLKQRSGSCGDDSMLSMHSHSSSNSDGVGRGSRLNKV